MSAHAIEMLRRAVTYWSRETPHPTRRQLRDLVEFLTLNEVDALDAMRRDFDNRERYPERPMILVSPDVNTDVPSVWLLGWRQHDWTPIHDHVKSHAAVKVIDHEVTECIYWPSRSLTLPSNGPVAMVKRELHAGSAITIPAPYIHAVGNVMPNTSATLHAYYPPLAHMNFYDTDSEYGKLTNVGTWQDHTP